MTPLPALPPLPLRLLVVEEEGRPVVDAAWVDRELAEANRLLAPHGVTVVASELAALPAPYAALENAVDRDGLARERKPGVVNVFVVRSLRDVDVPTRFILGVRWRLLRDTSKDYVILSSIASPTTLAHELGHLLGLDHSGVVDNVMSYRRADPARLAFDAAQGAKMLRTARARIARGEIVPPAPLGASTTAPCRASP